MTTKFETSKIKNKNIKKEKIKGRKKIVKPKFDGTNQLSYTKD